MTTSLENLEMSGNLTAVRVFTKSLGSFGENLVREKLKTVFICIFASILEFAELVHFILVSDHALLHSYHHREQ